MKNKKKVTLFTSVALSLLVLFSPFASALAVSAESVQGEGNTETVSSPLPTVNSTEERFPTLENKGSLPSVNDGLPNMEPPKNNDATQNAVETPTAPVKNSAPLIGVQADATVVTDWESFVRALGDSSVSQITLGNDLSLSGTLPNYDGVFDKASVNTDTGSAYMFVSKAGISRSLVIDGGGFSFDFGNLAIGFTNASVNTSRHWNITLQNINVESTNPHAPFYYPNLRGAENNGMTAYLSNSKLNYGSGYSHVKNVNNYRNFFLAYANKSVTTVNFTDDIVVPSGTVDLNFQLPDNRNNAPTNVFNVTSIANSSAGTSFIYVNIYGSARTMTVEGNGHSLDLGAITLCVYELTTNISGTRTTLWKQTYQNLNIYHGNYWGAIILNDLVRDTEVLCSQRFLNINNYGAQFVQAEESVLYFGEKIHIEQQTTYNSLKKDGSPLRTDGIGSGGNSWRVNVNTNQTIGVLQATIEDDADVYLSSVGGVVVDLWGANLGFGGNFIIGKNANVTMVRGSEVNSGEGGESVVNLRGGNFVVGEGSTVDVISNHNSYPSVIRLMNSSAVFSVAENATVNVVQDSAYNGTGNGENYSAIYMAGGSIDVKGTLNVTSKNSGSIRSDLIRAPGNVRFVIGSKGSLDVKSYGTNREQVLLYMGGSGSSNTFQFSDAQRVNLQRMTTLSGANTTNNGLIYSGGTLNVAVQNVYQWELNNMNGGGNGDEGYTYAYEPMSKMDLSYRSSNNPRIDSANSMTNETRTRFMNNFTTRGQQRVLFTRIPDPNVEIHSIANDNPNDPGSVTVHGYAIPNTYIRIWDEALNGTTAAKSKGTGDMIVSPVEDATADPEFLENYTVKADAAGNWSYTLPSGTFTAGNVVHVYGFSNLKSEEKTQVVLDKTPPTADGKTYYITKGDTLPAASTFVENVADTSPINTGFDYAFTDDADVESKRNTVGTHTIQINVSDRAKDADGADAPNTAVIDATLVVYDAGHGIEGDDIECSVTDVQGLSDTELTEFILTNSDPSAFKLSNGTKVDLTDKIEVQDFGGLEAASLNVGDYTVTLVVKAADSGLASDITTTITVTLTDDVPPTGKGKLTLVAKDDAAFFTGMTDLSVLLSEYSDNVSAKDDITIEFATGIDFAALVATPGDKTIHVILTDEAGNKSVPIAVPIRVKEEGFEVDGTVALKGDNFKVDKSAWDAADTAGTLREFIISNGGIEATEVQKVGEGFTEVDVTNDETKLTINSSAVGTDEEEAYDIVLKVTGADGSEKEKTITVTFNDKTVPTATEKDPAPRFPVGVSNATQITDLDSTGLKGLFASVSDNVSKSEDITAELAAGQNIANMFATTGDKTIEIVLTDEAGNKKTVSLKITIFDNAVIVKFEDRNGNELETPIEIKGFSAGQTIDLTDPDEGDDVAAVIAAIAKIEGKLYKIYEPERPADETAIPVTDAGTIVTYVFDGTLGIYSVPTDIDFGIEQVGTNAIRVDDPVYTGDLVIWDNRFERTGWSLRAQLVEELTNQSDTSKFIPNAIHYRKVAGDPTSEFSLTFSAQEVVTHAQSENQFNVTDAWRTTDTGFRLEVPAGSVKGLGKYQAVLKWTLSDVPSGG